MTLLAAKRTFEPEIWPVKITEATMVSPRPTEAQMLPIQLREHGDASDDERAAQKKLVRRPFPITASGPERENKTITLGENAKSKRACETVHLEEFPGRQKSQALMPCKSSSRVIDLRVRAENISMIRAAAPNR